MQIYNQFGENKNVSQLTAIFKDKETYAFKPHKDITPYEVALLLPIIYSPKLSQNGKATKYLEENNLMRHFVKIVVEGN